MSTRKKAPKEEIHAVTRRGEFLRCSTHDPFNKGVGQNNEGLMVIFPTMDLQEIFNLVDSGRTHTSRSSRRLVTRITIKWWCFSKRSPPQGSIFRGYVSFREGKQESFSFSGQQKISFLTTDLPSMA